MKRYLEKKIRKYVIATIGNPTWYLRKTPGESEYCFVEDIEIATKSLTSKIMNDTLELFRSTTGSKEDLVVVPIEITYEFIDDEY